MISRRAFVRAAATGLFVPAAPAILRALPGPMPFTLMSGVPPTPTQRWVNAVVAAGGTVSGGRQTLVDTMITGLQTDGLWSKLDRLWLLAAENTQSAQIDMVALDQVSVNNAPTFTTDRGYAGNGTNAYLKTGYKPNLGPKFSLNSAMMSVYQNVANSALTSFACGNATGGNPNDYLAVKDNNGKISGSINDFAGGGFAITTASALGLFTVSRTGASAVGIYRNGSSLGTTAVSSSAVDSGFMELLGSQAFGAYTDGRIAMASFGGGFNSTDASNFNSRITTYLTAIGAN